MLVSSVLNQLAEYIFQQKNDIRISDPSGSLDKLHARIHDPGGSLDKTLGRIYDLL